MVAAIIVLNLMDALLTLLWVQLGAAREANPLMAELLHRGPVFFVLGKVALVSAGVYLLWMRRAHVLSVLGIFLLFAVYYALILYHLRPLHLDWLSRWLS